MEEDPKATKQPVDQSTESPGPAPAATAPVPIDPMTRMADSLDSIASSMMSALGILNEISNHVCHIDERVTLNPVRVLNHVRAALPGYNDERAVVLYGRNVFVTNVEDMRGKNILTELDAFLVVGSQEDVYVVNKATITASNLIDTAKGRDLVERAAGRRTHLIVTGRACLSQPDVIAFAELTGLAVTVTPESLDRVQVLRKSAGVRDFASHEIFKLYLLIAELKGSSGGGKKDLAVRVVRTMSRKREERLSYLRDGAVKIIPELLASAGAAVGAATRGLNLAVQSLKAASGELEEIRMNIAREQALPVPPEKRDYSLQRRKAEMEARIREARMTYDARKQLLSLAQARVGKLLPRLRDFYGGKAEEVIVAGRKVIGAAASAEQRPPGECTTDVVGAELECFAKLAARLWEEREARWRSMLVPEKAPSG